MLLVLLALLGCGRSEEGRLLEPLPQSPPPVGSQPPRPPVLLPEPPLPPSCPAIACVPQSFEVRLERSIPWPAGTYYIRASVDGGPRRACSVVFEPVLGAAHDTCDGAELPFVVQYRYDDLEQAISAVSFAQARSVQLSVLTSEEAPPLLEIEHQIELRNGGSLGCGSCPPSPVPLSVSVSEPWQLTDAGSGDAGLAPPDGGTVLGGTDAGRDAGG